MLKINKYYNLTLSLILLVLLATGCTTVTASTTEVEPAPVQSVEQVTLKVSGSGSTTAILAAVAADFAADTPGYKLEVLPGSGTGGGVKGIVEGALDVAAMARVPKEEEAAQGVEFVEIGQAGQGFIVHPEVDVAGLTTEQAVAIFTAEVTNWSEVDGPDLPVILYVRDEGDSSTKALRKTVLGDTPFPDTIVKVLTSQGEMMTAVEGTPGGVGYGTWPSALARGAEVKALTVDGLSPTDPNYPMASTLGVGYLTERQAEVQPLLDWLASENGQTALRRYGMIIK